MTGFAGSAALGPAYLGNLAAFSQAVEKRRFSTAG